MIGDVFLPDYRGDGATQEFAHVLEFLRPYDTLSKLYPNHPVLRVLGRYYCTYMHA